MENSRTGSKLQNFRNSGLTRTRTECIKKRTNPNLDQIFCFQNNTYDSYERSGGSWIPDLDINTFILVLVTKIEGDSNLVTMS